MRASAVQRACGYAFACVNRIDYLEFRKPLPHQCEFSTDPDS